jgi:hypothetical protein
MSRFKTARPDYRFPGGAFFPEDETRVRWLRADEELLVLEPMPSPFREIAKLAALTLMRQTEIRTLRDVIARYCGLLGQSVPERWEATASFNTIQPFLKPWVEDPRRQGGDRRRAAAPVMQAVPSAHRPHGAARDPGGVRRRPGYSVVVTGSVFTVPPAVW